MHAAEGCREGGLIVAVVLGLGLPVSDPSVAGAGGFKGRKYYLTQGTFDGSQALTACVEKYHMASIWEILDVTSLSYALELGPTIVTTQADMGSGPPTGVAGWVRTGFLNNNSAAAGFSNCSTWTSNDGGNRGPRVQLPTDWTAAGTLVAPWQASFLSCNNPALVWCVADK